MLQGEPEIKSFETSDDLCLAVAQLAIDRIRAGLSTNGVFHLALTGGVTGTLITEHLVAIWNQHLPRGCLSTAERRSAKCRRVQGI